jgi:hypothetical protein
LPGTWNTSTPPIRSGAYFNFTAALQAVLSAGVTGTTAILGTSNWGPVGVPTVVSGLGQYDSIFGRASSGSTLRDAALAALDGFDTGGASRVLAVRLAGSSAAKSAVTLNDSVPAAALILTAKYEGDRADSFTVTVQTNAINASNKDLILYENGVELERWENVASGYNNNFETAINTTKPSQYVDAAVSGSSSRALANIVGTVGGAGGFAGGDSGTTLATGDVTDGLDLLNAAVFDTVALASISATASLDALVAWHRDRNKVGKRCFAVIGGAADEDLPTAQARAAAYDVEATYGLVAPNVVNLGVTDVRRLTDSVVLPTADIAPRYAGSLANIGFTRDMTNVRWTGYQVAGTALTPDQYAEAQVTGVVVFDNDTTERVSLDNAVTTLLTTNEDERPESLQETRTVAICHFIENTLQQVARDVYMGSLPNTETGRRDLVGSFLKFLRSLEAQGALKVGESNVHLDDQYQQTGDAVFVVYDIVPQGVVKRIFGTVRLGTG